MTHLLLHYSATRVVEGCSTQEERPGRHLTARKERLPVVTQCVCYSREPLHHDRGRETSKKATRYSRTGSQIQRQRWSSGPEPSGTSDAAKLPGVFVPGTAIHIMPWACALHVVSGCLSHVRASTYKACTPMSAAVGVKIPSFHLDPVCPVLARMCSWILLFSRNKRTTLFVGGIDQIQPDKRRRRRGSGRLTPPTYRSRHVLQRPKTAPIRRRKSGKSCLRRNTEKCQVEKALL